MSEMSIVRDEKRGPAQTAAYSVTSSAIRALLGAGLILGLTGCGSVSNPFASKSNTPLVGSPNPNPVAAANTPNAGPPTGPGSDIDPLQNCPSIDIRQGAATLSISGSNSADRSATDLRYQASLGQLARECTVRGPTMTIKVGTQGRVVLGPVGGPGDLVIPIRYAVVKEGVEPKTIVTTIHRVPVNIPPGQGNVAFSHIEENLTFPTPSVTELETYVIYVGFDPLSEQPKRAPARRAKPRS
jgi:hypothetical protein